MKKITDYRTILFDCDGVVLNSNTIKTDAFYKAGLEYGNEAADKLVQYHLRNGGMSRYKKFEYFLEFIVHDMLSSVTLDELLRIYSSEVRQGLILCEVTGGLEQLRNATRSAHWIVVSGGDQNELRDIFSERSLDEYFDGGVFGSPDDKVSIFNREILNNNIKFPAIYLGDSRLDHIASSESHLDFVFVSQWTEFKGWVPYCKQNGIEVVAEPADLCAV